MSRRDSRLLTTEPDLDRWWWGWSVRSRSRFFVPTFPPVVQFRRNALERSDHAFGKRERAAVGQARRDRRQEFGLGSVRVRLREERERRPQGRVDPNHVSVQPLERGGVERREGSERFGTVAKRAEWWSIFLFSPNQKRRVVSLFVEVDDSQGSLDLSLFAGLRRRIALVLFPTPHSNLFDHLPRVDVLRSIVPREMSHFREMPLDRSFPSRDVPVPSVQPRPRVGWQFHSTVSDSSALDRDRLFVVVIEVEVEVGRRSWSVSREERVRVAGYGSERTERVAKVHVAVHGHLGFESQRSAHRLLSVDFKKDLSRSRWTHLLALD